MQTTIALLGLAAVAYAAPQASLAPTSAAPAGCSPNYSGTFEISAYNTTVKRDLSKVRRLYRFTKLQLTKNSALPAVETELLSSP